MAAVYVNNLVINAGSDFSQTFNLETSDTNSALDLTGYTATAQMRKSNLGKIIVSLSSAQTTNLKPGRYVYDVVITRNSIKSRVIEGMVLVREGVTR